MDELLQQLLIFCATALRMNTILYSADAEFNNVICVITRYKLISCSCFYTGNTMRLHSKHNVLPEIVFPKIVACFPLYHNIMALLFLHIILSCIPANSIHGFKQYKVLKMSLTAIYLCVSSLKLCPLFTDSHD